MPRLIHQKTVISCMGIIITQKHNITYVVLLRDKDNCWVIPKGHNENNENNENFIETAIREVKEETGININKHNFISKISEYEYYTDKEKCNKLIKAYLFKIAKKAQIIPLYKENFVEGKWFPIDEAIKIVTYKEQKEVLNKVIKCLSK